MKLFFQADEDSPSGKRRFRGAPSMPYQLGVEVLTVPIDTVELTATVFAAYATRRLEAVCFWYGDRGDGAAIVRAVVVPEQRNSWGNYQVTADSMDDVARATRDLGWKNLAQVHTHPGRSVEHSKYDDEHANSRRALSIVVPFYGQRVDSGGIVGGVHEWQNDFWHLLPHALGARRVRVGRVEATPVDLIDTRKHLGADLQR